MDQVSETWVSGFGSAVGEIGYIFLPFVMMFQNGAQARKRLALQNFENMPRI